MSWLNASAANAADRKNAEWSAWDHSKESPDGYGRRDSGDFSSGPVMGLCPTCGGSAVVGRLCDACQATKNEADRAAAVSAAAAQLAEFERHPLVVDSGARMIEDMDDSGNCRWVPAAVFAEKYPAARVVGGVAKCAPSGYEFRTR